jgi:ABC-type uncharacterized transport system involved in gliding motility auxiliary subunit
MNPYVANTLSVLRNSLDRATSTVEGASKSRLAWGGLALAALTFLSFNLLSQTWFRGWKADVTKDSLYTISPGTRKALAAIDEPIDLQVYFSKKLGDAAPQYAKTFERVRTLLEQYRSISGNRLRVTYLDPEAFSDAEDRAVAAGLKGIRLNQDGDQGYFGIAGTNATDTEANIPFFAADRERFVEYDVTKLVYSLANPKKKAIGLLSTVSLEGGMDPMQGMRGRPTPPQMILEQIREVFEIKSIARDTTEISRDIDVLMLVQPDGLSAQTTYAIDQFVLRGGKLLAFIDPVAETAKPAGPMMMGPQPPNFTEMDKLLKAWGVAFDPMKVATDIAHARRVQFGGARGGTVTEYIAWLGLDKRNLDAKDVLSASVEKLNFGTAGSFAKADGATTTFSPLLSTSPRAMQVGAERVMMMPDAVGLLRGYKAEGKALTLAARLAGSIKSAYPEGAPTAAAKPDDKKPGEVATDKTEKKEPPVAAGPPATPHLATGTLNAILIADSDLLNDQFWVDVREFLGQQVAMPNAHNATFVLAALENLSGSEALLSLRGRGVTDRPFEKVNDIRRDAEQRFRDKEQGLTTKLKGLQDQLTKVERQTESGEVVLSDKDRAAIEKFRGEMVSTRRELRDVKLALRQDIDRLDGWLKFINIAGVPLLIACAGLWYASRRRRPAAL